MIIEMIVEFHSLEAQVEIIVGIYFVEIHIEKVVERHTLKM